MNSTNESPSNDRPHRARAVAYVGAGLAAFVGLTAVFAKVMSSDSPKKNASPSVTSVKKGSTTTQATVLATTVTNPNPVTTAAPAAATTVAAGATSAQAAAAATGDSSSTSAQATNQTNRSSTTVARTTSTTRAGTTTTTRGATTTTTGKKSATTVPGGATTTSVTTKPTVATTTTPTTKPTVAPTTVAPTTTAAPATTVDPTKPTAESATRLAQTYADALARMDAGLVAKINPSKGTDLSGYRYLVSSTLIPATMTKVNDSTYRAKMGLVAVERTAKVDQTKLYCVVWSIRAGQLTEDSGRLVRTVKGLAQPATFATELKKACA